MNNWTEWNKKDVEDNISRIIIWADYSKELKDVPYQPFSYRYEPSKEHNLIEVGWVCEKGSEEHKYFKKRFNLKLKDRLE
jgi:hypothetical protein